MANQQFNERWKNTICGDKQGPLLAETPQTHGGMRWSSWQGMSHSTSLGGWRGWCCPHPHLAQGQKGQKDTGTATLARLDSHSSPKNSPWEKSFRKEEEF